MSDRTSDEWAKVAPDGSLEYIDWDVAERLAELHRSGVLRTDATSIASLAVAVRECVLRCEKQKMP